MSEWRKKITTRESVYSSKKLKKSYSLVNNPESHEHGPAPSPSFKAKFYAGEEQQFKQEWGRLQQAVIDLYKSIKITKNNEPEATRFPKGTLSLLHDDVHVLIRSKAGSFVFDFLQKRLLPAATQILYDEIIEKALNQRLPPNININLRDLIRVWKHFYSNILPDLQMIFAQVKNESQGSVRTSAMVAFRDGVILKMEEELEVTLQDFSKNPYKTSVQHMFLILQGVCEKYPPTENKLRLEQLVALVISPYQGHRGLYRNYSWKPEVVSNELEVAHLRRLSVVDPRKLTRPLSMHSNQPLETLQDLFALSADRTKQKGRSGNKRSISISEDFIIGSLGF